MGMTVQEMRASVLSVLNTDSSGYPAISIDRAARFAFNEALRRTRANTTAANVTLTGGSATVDITASITGFQPSWWVHGEVNYYPVVPRAYRQLADAYAEGETTTISSAQPYYIGWMTASRALIWPTPEANATMIMAYWKPLVTWTAGDTGAGTLATQLNVPDDMVDAVIRLGVAPSLVDSSPNVQISRRGWFRDFIDYLNDIAGSYAADQGPFPIGGTMGFGPAIEPVADPS